MRVDMDDLCPALFGPDNIGKGHRVRLGHIAAHNQDGIAIDQILRKGGGTAPPKRYTQTGYR